MNGPRKRSSTRHLVQRQVRSAGLVIALQLAAYSCRAPHSQGLDSETHVLDEFGRRASGDEIARMQTAVLIRELPARSVNGFHEHWRKGTQTALYNPSTVLVLDSTRPTMLEVSKFPEEYGYVGATGWEEGERFFVHLMTSPHAGTMVYVDLERRQVTDMVHWSGW